VNVKHIYLALISLVVILVSSSYVLGAQGCCCVLGSVGQFSLAYTEMDGSCIGVDKGWIAYDADFGAGDCILDNCADHFFTEYVPTCSYANCEDNNPNECMCGDQKITSGFCCATDPSTKLFASEAQCLASSSVCTGEGLSCGVRGRVLDSTGDSVADATVRISNHAANTDVQGSYAFVNVPIFSTSATVTASAPDFQDKSITLSFPASGMCLIEAQDIVMNRKQVIDTCVDAGGYCCSAGNVCLGQSFFGTFPDCNTVCCRTACSAASCSPDSCNRENNWLCDASGSWVAFDLRNSLEKQNYCEKCVEYDFDCRIDVSLCGNGAVNSGEVCGETALGNCVSGLECVDCRCLSIGECGNGVRESSNGELCDDGNRIDDDFCSNTCKLKSVSTKQGIDCKDGVDNDGDGLSDFPDDPGCYAAEDLSELNPAIECDDGLDNDLDTKIDFPNDPECFSADSNSESESCQQLPKPTNLLVKQGQAGAIEISWLNKIKVITNLDIHSWIFRSDTPLGPFVRVASSFNATSRKTQRGWLYKYEDSAISPGKKYYYYVTNAVFKNVDSKYIPAYACEHTEIQAVSAGCDISNDYHLKCNLLNPAECGCCLGSENIYANGRCVPFGCSFNSPVTTFAQSFYDCNFDEVFFNFNTPQSQLTYFVIPINARVTSAKLTVTGGIGADNEQEEDAENEAD